MTTLTQHKLATVEQVRQFALAGDSIITIKNPVRMTHVTLWITKAQERPGRPSPYFVKIFTGEDNGDGKHYRYAGCIWQHDRNGQPQKAAFAYGGIKARRNGFTSVDARVKAAEWLGRVLAGADSLDAGMNEIWHEGRCCFCHRPLTQPESVERGYGPECADQRGLPYGAQTKRQGAGEPEPKGGEPSPEPKGADAMALTVECPRCSAAAFKPCRAPSGVERALHQDRISKEYRERVLRRGTEPTPPPEPTTPAPGPTSTSPLVERAMELQIQGWTREAAVEQALHESRGFPIWSPSHGLPQVVVQVGDRAYELETLPDDNDETDTDEEEAA